MKQHIANNVQTTKTVAYQTVAQAVREIAPAHPLYLLWQEKIAANARRFLNEFPGETVYAFKCNPSIEALTALRDAGITAYDVASIEEVRTVSQICPGAKMYFMHTIKSPESIREAYFTYGVRAFVLDSMDELYKIMRATDLAQDLELFVRLALPKNGKAQIDFSAKFGALPYDCADLLAACRPVATRLGLCLHVGTQTTDPIAYKRAIKVAAKVIDASGVKVDALDVGGGFPVAYPGQDIPPFSAYMDTIKTALKTHKLDHMPLLCEPGRALVATGGSLVVRVEARKGDLLYINDGTYGGLFDAGKSVKGRFKTNCIASSGDRTGEQTAFRFAGPTCCSIDMMAGPFMLPADIQSGDWIEIETMGAYSYGMRSNFNGFGASDFVLMS